MLIFIGPNRQRGNLHGFKVFPDAPAYKHKTYSWLFRTRRLPAATYIFTFIDRLHPRERRLASKIYHHINEAGAGFKALNDPAAAKNRYRLLRTLYDHGVNQFNAYLASDAPQPNRFPVFVRHLSVSLPPLTQLLENQDALDDALTELEQKGEPLDDLVVIEFCAVPYQGEFYAKLAAYRIDQTISFNMMLFDEKWYVKYRDVDHMPPDASAFEAKLMKENAFQDEVRRVFELANIEYGRVDFGLVEGRPQFYEINFHPHFSSSEFASKDPQRLENVTLAAQRRLNALNQLDQQTDAPAIANISDSEITAFRLRPWRNFAPQRY
ncbi:hypothetical protein ATL17_3030 [Maritalea mobilis]|uniref:ATP-grasp domain-containing protein n=1 Tax=Maritalea mobilis TaxID=483324 RepID=A0A4R6VJX8_9HYPH|nr:hypothetical protein [Maritalea mobilis]TDQ61926.1 hypothetical protein ATL17_3030 [Maritalea mobilis]